MRTRRAGELIQPTDARQGLRTRSASRRRTDFRKKRRSARSVRRRSKPSIKSFAGTGPSSHEQSVRLLGAESEAVVDVAALQASSPRQAAAEQGDRTRMTAALTGLVGNRQAACRGRSGKETIARCLATTRTTRLFKANFGAHDQGRQTGFVPKRSERGGKRQGGNPASSMHPTTDPRSDLERVNRGSGSRKRYVDGPDLQRGGSTGATIACPESCWHPISRGDRCCRIGACIAI